VFCLLLSLSVCVCVVCCLLIGEIKICINNNNNVGNAWRLVFGSKKEAIKYLS